jgi:hypothetical protein
MDWLESGDFCVAYTGGCARNNGYSKQRNGIFCAACAI